ncbi:MHS family MFS transporter [Enterobacteriaceae bacterium 4M9]|nr:MHS family MFS transporter [Enterobacteriaceae bacterium 4M9]
MRKLVLSSLLGNSLEWYDFFLYGTAAALVFGELFFPVHGDSLLGTLLAFSGFAVGFLARPLGGVLFGHLGDRHSRKQALIVTLALMGGCTFLIGLLPGYQHIGFLAPLALILLRLVQGVACGGEWGGGVLMLSENATPQKKGFYTAWSQMGVSGGFVLSSLAFWLVRQLPDAAFMSWGWRLPFLASALLFVVAMYIRKNIEESRSFLGRRDEQAQAENMPLAQILRHHRRALLQAIALRLPENGAVYLFFTFSLVYCRHLGIPDGSIIACITLAMAVEFFSILFWGALADRIGFRRVYLIGTLGVLLLAFPFFWLLESAHTGAMLLAMMLALPFCHGAMTGAQPPLVAALFPAGVRYTGLSLGHEIGSILAGGLGPMVAVALLMAFDASWPVSLLLVAWGLCALVALWSLRGHPQR